MTEKQRQNAFTTFAIYDHFMTHMGIGQVRYGAETPLESACETPEAKELLKEYYAMKEES